MLLQEQNAAVYEEALMTLYKYICISEYVFQINYLKKRPKHYVLNIDP